MVEVLPPFDSLQAIATRPRGVAPTMEVLRGLRQLIQILVLSLIYAVLFRAAVKWVLRSDVSFGRAFLTVGACTLISWIMVYWVLPPAGLYKLRFIAHAVNPELWVGAIFLALQWALLFPASSVSLGVSSGKGAYVALVTGLVGAVSCVVVIFLVRAIWWVQRELGYEPGL